MTALEAAPIRDERAQDILSDDALEFLSELHSRFNPRRLELLQARKERGAPSGFLEETKEIREGDWSVVEPRPDYEDRRVEITGPTDRKLVITRSTAARRASWPTSRMQTPRPGATRSRAT